jgi:type IV secretory pathway VirB2 component (pilin)
MLDVGRGIVIGLQRARGTMDFASSLLLLAAIFVIGFGAGYAFRALISATHRRRYERHRGFPQQNSR